MALKIDNVDASGDGVVIPQIDLPQPKKMKIGKGDDGGRPIVGEVEKILELVVLL